MDRRSMLPIFGTVLVFAAIFGIVQFRRMRDAATEEGGVRQDPAALAARAAASKVAWQQASDALSRGDYREAFKLHADASSFEYDLQGNPGMEIEPGLTARDWLKLQKGLYASNVIAAFDTVVSNAVATPEKSGVLLDYYAQYHHEIPELDALYETRKLEVLAARLKAAGQWFRVVFTPEDSPYAQPVRAAIERTWDNRYGKTLVWGRTIDPGEKEATWMILAVNVSCEGQTYSVRDQREQVIHRQVPTTLRVAFEWKRKDPVVTSWDGLQGVSLSEDAPETIVGPEDQMHARVGQVASVFQNKLLAALTEKLTAWPKFELFPGRDPTQTPLLNNGRIDHAAALILSCLAPDRLRREVVAATWALPPEQRAELAKVSIHHDITSMVTWVTSVINVETEAGRAAIWEALRTRPMYGAFDPLLAMFSKASDGRSKVDILRACKGYLFDAKVMNAVLGAINQPGLDQRRDLVVLLLTECPHAMLASHMGLSADRDREVANAAIDIISRRDQKLRWQMMIDHFDQWDPPQKAAVLFNLHYNPHEHGPGMLAVFKKAAGRDQDASVREAAMKILLYETAGTPEGWTILEEIGNQETDPERAEKIREVLAGSVAKAHPGKAGAHALSAMLEGSPKQRRAAAQNYFRINGDVDARLKAVVPVLPQYADEPGFFEALLRGLSDSGMSHLKDPSVPEFRTMIDMAFASPYPMVRYFGAQLSKSAWSKGQTQYDQVLGDYMRTETNTWLLDQAAKFRAPMKADKAKP